MDDITLQKLSVFSEVAKHKTYTDAAKALGIDKSTLSRTVAALERELERPLFNRVKKTLVLTPEGRLLHAKAVSIVRSIEDLKAEISCLDNELSGNLRITTTHPIASTWLTKFIHEFLARHPQLQVQIIAGKDPLDLSLREADVALRPFFFAQGLKHEALRKWRLHLWASREYIARRGLPMNLTELSNHDLIVFGDTPSLYTSDHVRWPLKQGPGKAYRTPKVVINSLQGMFELVKAGVGIGTFSADNPLMENSDLVPVLQEQIYHDVELFLIYHERMATNSMVKAFRKCVFDYIANETTRTSVCRPVIS